MFWDWENVFGLVSFVLTYFYSDSEYKVCQSPGCIDQARKMTLNMNEKINPCDDFYKYACGNYQKQNRIPHEKYSWRNVDNLTLEFKEKIKEIMESNLDDYPEILKLIQKIYKSCMHLPLESQEFENFANLELEDYRGITNLSTNFISVTIDTNLSSSYANDLIMLAPLTRIPKEHEKYVIYKLWSIGYPNSPLTNQEKESIIDFEEKLANITTSVEPKVSAYKLDTLEELSNGTIDWKEFFRIHFNGTVENVDWSKQIILVADVDFFVEIGNILENTDENLIVNVVKWRLYYLLHNKIKYIADLYQIIKNNNTDFDFDDLPFDAVLKYFSLTEERWETCTDLILGNFGMAILNPYAQKYFPSSTKFKLNSMMDRIENSFKIIIENSEIISEDIKKTWSERTDGIERLIGYPDWILNSTQLAHYYENLELSNSSNFLISLYDVARWKITKDRGLLNTTFDKSIWLIDPLDITASFYFKMHNFIVVTAGFLQYPYYGMPLEVLNYAGIGFTLAHELIHAMIENNNFSLEKKCLIKQYGRYVADTYWGFRINGTFTYNENYADNGGIQLAFKAYKDFLIDERQGVEEERLPGLEHINSEQLFFLAYAQSMCAAYTSEAIWAALITDPDPHSPERFRVKGLYDNYREFSHVWNCPKPKKPCLIW